MSQEREDDRHLDLKLTLLMILVNFHYAIVAYNHTSPTFINFTPPFFCENAEKEKVFGCEKNKTELDEFCPNGYNFVKRETETTIITEWNLVCENNYYGPLATTIYMSGVTLGALSTGFMSDMLGRRPVILMCLYTQAVLGACMSVFVFSFPLYTIVRAVQGFFVQGLQGSTYTLLIEIIPKKYHTLVGVAAGVYWAFGLVILSGAAYFFPQWRHLQLVLSLLPVFFSLLYVWFLPESSKWLTLYNQTHKNDQNMEEVTESERSKHATDDQSVLGIQDQQQTVQDIATSNDKGVLLSNVDSSCSVPTHQRSESETVYVKHSLTHESQIKRDTGSTVHKRKLTIFRNLWSISVLRKYLVVMTVVWFSTSLAYYGVTFNLPTLSGDRYMNFLLGAVLEGLFYTGAYFCLSRGRRLPLFFSLLIGGILCIVAGLLPQTSNDYNWAGPTKTALALIGKGVVVIVFCAIYLYTSELFPTGVRAAVIGFCGFSSRVGSLLSPQLLYLVNYTNAAMPFLVMGICQVTACALVLSLPETFGQALPNTVEDAINISKNKKLKSDVSIRKEDETSNVQ